MLRKTLHFLLPIVLAAALCGSALAAAGDYLPGDVNRNGKVTAFDALLIQSHLHEEYTLDDEQIEIAICSNPEVTTLSSIHIMATLFAPVTSGTPSKVLPSQDGRYHISEPSQLIWLQTFPNASFVLEHDIDMAGASWSPSFFGGTLDGNGYCIRDLHTAATGSDVGVLFTKVSENALVENLSLYDCTLTTEESAESVGLIAGLNLGTVRNCGAVRVLCNGQPMYAVDESTTEIVISDTLTFGTARGITYLQPITVRYDGGQLHDGFTFRDCTFTQGLNGLMLTGVPGKDPSGSFEAEYHVSKKEDGSIAASLRLFAAADASFIVSGTLTDDLIVCGNADLSQVVPGNRAIGLTCGENGRIACNIGDNFVQVLTAGIYDLTGVNCGKLLFGEGAVIYWNGSEKPLPVFISWPAYSALGKMEKDVFYNAFPSYDDFSDWRKIAQDASAIHPVIIDGYDIDLRKS